MNITAEQAESDAAKVKALRTSVGWFSSPACSLIYQTSKYVAAVSDTPTEPGREETYHTYPHMEARRRAPACARME